MTTASLSPSAATRTCSSSHSRSNSQSYFFNKNTDTPCASPCAPQSGGQHYPSKASPGAPHGLADARTPSYFALTIEPSADPRDSCLVPRENWSSPTSSIKSFGAAIPQHIPVDANPEFEAFRKQANLHHGVGGFALSTSHFTLPTGALTPRASTPSTAQRPKPPRWHTHASDGGEAITSRLSWNVAGPLRGKETTGSKSSADNDSLRDSAYGSGDSKRNSDVSLNPPPFLSLRTHESPAQLQLPFPPPERPRPSFALNLPGGPRSVGGAIAGKPELSHPPANAASQESQPLKSMPGDPHLMPPRQLRDLLAEDSHATVLILDVRIQLHYAQSRIEGALNLCLPTTLLKRPAFNLERLKQNFQAESDQKKFASWRDATHLVVYDAHSMDCRDAVSAMHMIKKFTNEGFSGSANILRGGFNAFAAAHPELVDRSSGSSPPSLSLGGDSGAPPRPGLAPVFGGVLLPGAAGNPTPFFSNIRQNQDLRDGVGQMDVSLPPSLDASRLPRWLREAADAGDHGKKVSDKFLKIEEREKSRMLDAYSVQKPQASEQTATPATKVQLSGIEQGVKNRYKDILPFEHARVRLQGRPEGTCDYVNASHIRASRSHKRYIASQGPLPATFEDFWSVIWDQDVRVIVMLTAEFEGGQNKCGSYWKGNDYGPFRLRATSEQKVSLDKDLHRVDSTASTLSKTDSHNSAATAENSTAEVGRRRANTTTTLNAGGPTTSQSSASETPYVIVRKFALSHAGHPFSPIREVTQLHFPSWPDFGAPAQPSHLLALVELANSHQRPYATYDAPESGEHVRPMLVHCSAGCGRTGAFCTVDSVIDMLKRQRQRAAQRAHKRIGERGRSWRSQQTDDKARIKRQAVARDSEGDVSMSDGIAPFAPMDESIRRLSTDSGSRSEPDHSSDETDIDTSWLDDDNIDLIARTVEDFRGQRLSMVQSLRQFVLCYETVIEWLAQAQDRGDKAATVAKGRVRSGSMRV